VASLFAWSVPKTQRLIRVLKLKPRTAPKLKTEDSKLKKTGAARNNEKPCTGGSESERSYRWPTRYGIRELSSKAEN